MQKGQLWNLKVMLSDTGRVRTLIWGGTQPSSFSPSPVWFITVMEFSSRRQLIIKNIKFRPNVLNVFSATSTVTTVMTPIFCPEQSEQEASLLTKTGTNQGDQSQCQFHCSVFSTLFCFHGSPPSLLIGKLTYQSKWRGTANSTLSWMILQVEKMLTHSLKDERDTVHAIQENHEEIKWA